MAHFSADLSIRNTAGAAASLRGQHEPKEHRVYDVQVVRKPKKFPSISLQHEADIEAEEPSHMWHVYAMGAILLGHWFWQRDHDKENSN